MRKFLSFLLVVTLLMMGCSDGTDIENTNNNEYKEAISNTNNSLFGISDDKVLSGEVIKKSRKEITLEITSDSIISEGTIWVIVEDKSMLADITKGQKVNVWYDYIRESNPPQTRGLKIERNNS
ncbi:MAG: YobA family protein [Bacillaceae bacterium]|nr:YobA family protein [Bacillaceae bacterium]